MKTVNKSYWSTYSSKKTLRITLIYLVISIIWIFGSDKLVNSYYSDVKVIEQISIIKGWLFVICTSAIIYFLVHHAINTIQFQQKHLEINVAKLKYLFGWASDGIFLSDQNGIYTDVNTRGYKMLGYNRDEIIGKHISDLVIFEPDSIPLQLDKLNQGETIISERKLKKKDGSYIYAEISAKMLPNKYFQAIVRDITERNKFEEELKSKTEELNLYFNRSLDLLCISDSEGYFHRLNPEWERTLGYSISELEGKRFLDFVHPDDFNSTLSVMNRLSEDERILNFVNRYRRKDGTYCWLEWNATPVGTQIYAVARDITDRKQVEEKLKEQEQLLIETGKIAKVGGWEFDTATLKGTWTPEVARIHDLDPEQETSVDIGISFYHGENRTKIEKAIREAIELRKSYDLELEIVTAAGKSKWIRTIGNPVIKDNKVVKVRGSFQDITERKQVEIALRESEERYRKLVDIAPDAIAILSEGKVVFVNYSAVNLMNAKKESDLIGKPIFEIIHPDKLHDSKNRMERMINGETGLYPVEDKYIRLDGVTITVEVTATPLLYNNKPALLIIARDITDRKESEKALHESESNLAAAQAMAKLGSWELNIATLNGTWSAEMFRLFNRDPNLGVPPLEEFMKIVHPEDRQFVLDKHQYAITTGEPTSFEFRRNPDLGPVRNFLVQMEPLKDSNDKIVTMTGTNLDITERKAVETELLKSRERYRSLSAHLQTIREEERASIAREMHDELGQILTSLKMNLSLLRRQIEDKTKTIQPHQIIEELNSTIVMIDKAVNRVRKLITQLRPELLDKLGLVAALEWYVQEFSGNTQIQCELSCPYDDLVLGQEIELAVFRIVQEALSNAARHSGANKVTIDIEKRNNEIVFEIKDNGKGILEEELKGDKSFGLIGMRERANLIGASLEISGEFQKGTIIKLLIKY